MTSVMTHHVVTSPPTSHSYTSMTQGKQLYIGSYMSLGNVFKQAFSDNERNIFLSHGFLACTDPALDTLSSGTSHVATLVILD